jgi:DnaJ-class molecular chaperone
MPISGEERGDLHVEITIPVPKQLTSEEKALLYDFERSRASRLDPAFLKPYCFGRLSLPPEGRYEKT